MKPFDLYSSSCSKDMHLINEISDGASTTDFGGSVNDRGELTMIDESESDHSNGGLDVELINIALDSN